MNRTVAPYASALLVSIFLMSSQSWGAADPYAVISKKNLFRPDRTEWILEKSDGKMVDKKIDTSKLSLFGTVIVGNKKSAIIHDKDAGKAAGKKNPAEEPAGKKNEIYSLGDYIGGYVISAIEEKKVVLDYYGEKVTLNLHEGKEAAKGDYTPIEDSTGFPAARTAGRTACQTAEAKGAGAAGSKKGKRGDGRPACGGTDS